MFFSGVYRVYHLLELVSFDVEEICELIQCVIEIQIQLEDRQLSSQDEVMRFSDIQKYLEKCYELLSQNLLSSYIAILNDCEKLVLIRVLSSPMLKGKLERIKILFFWYLQLPR